MAELNAAVLNRLEALARGAQEVAPGPWRWREWDCGEEVEDGDYADLADADGGRVFDDGSAGGEYPASIISEGDTAQYIAACDPATLLTLVAAARELLEIRAVLRGARAQTCCDYEVFDPTGLLAKRVGERDANSSVLRSE